MILRPFTKWPVLLAAAMCIGLGAVLIREVPNGNIVTGMVLITMGALLLGAFLTLYILALLAEVGERSPPEGGNRST